MSVIAANMANADTVTPPGGTPYRAREVVFQAAPVDAGDGELADAGTIDTDSGDTAGQALGVTVAGTVQTNASPTADL